MLFKLSLKNIKKSIRDYSIYFFTLVVAVSMFYIFNSMDAQTSMFALSESKYEIIKMLVQLLGYISVFVSFILGFLIIYSNNFLIKRRKKEIGLYLTLGMSKSKVSLILVIETILVGIVSLIVGLLIGITLSQLLSVFTAKLFEADLNSFKFVFSNSAFIKTIIYFSIIFLLVIVFNVFTLSRYKLIDLLHAGIKNEQIKIRNKYITFISFILSILLIGYAYYLLFDGVLLMMDYRTLVMLICGALGTLLLFFSLSGFLINIFKKRKKVYNKGLNMFVLNQVNSRINTTVISTTLICLMLLLTIGILSSSLSLAKVYNSDLSDNNKTDYTVKIYNKYGMVNDEFVEIKDNNQLNSIDDLISNSNINKYSKDYIILHRYYNKTISVKDIMTKADIDKLIKEYGSSISLDGAVSFIKESEYKKLMSIQGNDYIDIDKNEYLLLSNIDFIINAYNDYYKNKTGIVVGDNKLVPATSNIIKVPIENFSSAGNDGAIVVSDELVSSLDMLNVSIIGNYTNEDIKESEFSDFLASTMSMPFDIRTKINMQNASIGVKAVATFIGLYLGITFAVTSATILAIKELSESSDNKKRYKILSQIGADDKMINRALFMQILISFLFPLIVALVHSYVGLKEVNGLIISFGNIDLASNIFLTTLFMLIVYGGYFLATYLCSKSIIKDNK